MQQYIRSIAKAARKQSLFWRYGFNLKPTVSYRLGKGNQLNGTLSGIVDELNRNGFAKTSLETLFGDQPVAAELDTKLRELVVENEAGLKSMSELADDASLVGDKNYSVELLGSQVTFDNDSVLPRLALNESLLKVANAYLGMYAKLRYYNIWYTLPTSGVARESQLWHFDREDNYILKVFIYLSDVDEGAGPFWYAPGTHRKGAFKHLKPEQFDEKGVLRSTDEQMDRVFPKDRWITATGKKGTVIFADTRGFHKGGEARTDKRVLFTAMYTSPASQSKRLLEVSPDLDLSGLSQLQLKALR